MIVKSADFSMQASHAQMKHRREHVQVEIFRPQRAEPQQRAPRSEAMPERPPAAAGKQPDCCCNHVCDDSAELTPKWQLLRAVIEALTGRLLEVFDASDLEADPGAETAESSSQTPAETAPRSSGGMRVTHSYEYAEFEAMQFQAVGEIKTADGRSIQFEVQLEMQRSVLERSQSEIIWGDVPRMKDPLVINFDGRAAQLTADRYEFDLDADGAADSIPGLSGGRAYLVLDRNGNGKVDNGSELLGAMSGDAFADLRKLDQDGNGFIDAGDAAYQELGLWRPENEAISSLADKRVAALSTHNVASEFQMNDAQGNQQGQLRATSIYLKDDGSVGTSQQLDFIA